MSYKNTKTGLIIVLLAFGAIASYTSVTQALLDVFISALVIPPIAAIISVVYLGKKAYLQNEAVQ